MLRRRAALILVLSALTTAVVAPPVPTAAATCTPSVESVTRNGLPPVGYDVTVTPVTSGGEHQLLWNVTTGSGYELGASARSDVWVIALDTCTVIPRVAFTHGDHLKVARSRDGDGTYHVTITATPILLTGECNQSIWPWTCPTTATQQWDGYLDGTVTDYGSWTDVAQRNAMWGMDYSTNVSATSLPPEIQSDASTGADQLLVRLANPHFQSDGTTVFRGFVHLRIPNAFLHIAYDIDDPTTLTSAGLDPALGGSGGGSVTVSTASGAMLVDGARLTFSARTLRIHRGVVTPRRPTHLRSVRATAHRARLRFDESVARGSKVTSFAARCVSRSGSSVAKRTGHGSPLRVKGLRAGVAYTCKVRARSKAGKGPWSAKVKVRRSAAS